MMLNSQPNLTFLVKTNSRYTQTSLLLDRPMKSLILVKFLTFLNFDLTLNFCLNSALYTLFMGLIMNRDK